MNPTVGSTPSSHGRRRAPAAEDPHDASPSSRPERTSTLESARELARTQETTARALLAYREAVAGSGFSTDSLLEYARFLISNSRGSAAEEVLGLAIAQDGSQIDAIELYLELIRELDLPASRSAWVLSRLEMDVAGSPGAHRGALDYAIPSRLDGVLATIGAEGDPVSRAIVAINQLFVTEAATAEAIDAAAEGLGQNDRQRALLTVMLGRGNRKAAIELLEAAPVQAVPMNSLRRAIRRARAAGKGRQLTQYLEVYLRLRPGDGWATGLGVSDGLCKPYREER